MTGETSIVEAERKMGINRFANPYFVQVILLVFVLGPVIAGAAVARAISTTAPTLAESSSNDGWIFTGIVWIIIIAFGLKTFQVANSSKWFELGYCGDEADVDWAASFRMGKPVDMGEAVPLEVPLQTGSNGQPPKPNWGIAGGKYGTILRPKVKTALGHCWEIPFHDKHLPAILAWLPDEFEKCFTFEGHTVQAFFRGFPFNIENGTRGTFIRTSWTKDPDGTVIPIGVFSHSDLIAKQLRRDLEPASPVTGEVQALAQARDNYYRQQLLLDNQSKDRTITRLQEQLKKEENAGYEYAGALFQSAKGRHKREAEKIALGRKSRFATIAIVIALVIAGILGLLGRL